MPGFEALEGELQHETNGTSIAPMSHASFFNMAASDKISARLITVDASRAWPILPDDPRRCRAQLYLPFSGTLYLGDEQSVDNGGGFPISFANGWPPFVYTSKQALWGMGATGGGALLVAILAETYNGGTPIG